MAEAPTALTVRRLEVQFETYRGVVRALRGVDLEVRPGEMLGIVGQVGSGKSVLAQAIMGTLPPTGRISGGEIEFQQRSLLSLRYDEARRLRGSKIALIVPNGRSALNPLLPVGRQIAQIVREHEGLRKQDALARAVDLIRAVGIPDPALRASAYPHELSGGMAQRIVIAMAMACSPRVVIADEPTTGLDVTIQMQVLDQLNDLLADTGSACLMMTRDLGIVANYCHRVVVLMQGLVVESAPVSVFFDDPRHAYSLRLLEAAAASRGARERFGERRREFEMLVGDARVREDAPGAEEPAPLVEVGEHHYARVVRKQEPVA
jgi:ABC-type dipeptide/oligopeptide/nickel transport system ATPase component